jgi:hypothetical protein
MSDRTPGSVRNGSPVGDTAAPKDSPAAVAEPVSATQAIPGTGTQRAQAAAAAQGGPTDAAPDVTDSRSVPAGKTVGKTAGAPAGKTAGPPAGKSAGKTAGATAVKTAGPQAGGTAGPQAGGTAGPQAGGTAGPQAGVAAGPSAAPPVGATAAPPVGGSAATDVGTGTTPAPDDARPTHRAAAEKFGRMGRGSAKAAGRGPRRARLQLRHIDTWSALKISLVLSIALFFIWMVAIGILYGVLNGLGVFKTLNDLFGQVSSVSGSKAAGDVITPGVVFGGAAVIGAINIVLMTALCTVGTFIYNLCSDLVGGLEITLSERD